MEILALCFLLLSVIVLALIKPQLPQDKQYLPFYARNFAHRGLHDLSGGIPENSLAAFRAAAENGYGMELDVHLTRDGELVVIHDNDLRRSCGVDGTVKGSDFEYLRRLRLFETEERIPTLSEVLKEVDGKTPLIVELKVVSADYKELCEKTWNLLKNYKGDFCIESFDPFAVGWFNRNHANVYRGQLVDTYSELSRSAPKIVAFFVANALTNIISRPHFIAHSMGKKSPMIRLAEWLGAKKIVWTSRSEKDGERLETENSAVIFENYRPKPKYYKERQS